MSAIPTKGIHVQSAMKYLFRRLIANDNLTDSYPRPDMYNADPSHFGGGSENMKLLYCAVGYIANHTAGRDRLINWYANEQGHGGGEPLTVSHCQLHLGGHGAIALHAYRSKDDLVLDLALTWLGIEYYLLSLCEVDGEPWTPGARGVSKGKVIGENPTRGKFLAAVRTGKSPKLNQYDLGACCVAKLPPTLRDRIEHLTFADIKSIEIQGNLSISRSGNTFAAVFESLPIREGGVQSAGYDGVDKWIYRDANTAEVAIKIGKLSSSKSANRFTERFKSPDIDNAPIKLKPKPINPITPSNPTITPSPPKGISLMPTLEKDFNRSLLWPKSNHNWMAPGAVKSVTATFGAGLDLGALRVDNGIWQILWTRTPTSTDQSSSEWIDFNPSNSLHINAANAFNRYGPGWSYGPGHNMHHEVIGYYTEVYGRKPTRMEQMDIEHNKGLWDRLVKDYQAKIGFVPGQPITPPIDPNPIDPPKPVPVEPVPVTPPVPLPATLALSSPEQRVQELLSLIPFRDMILPRFVIEGLPKALLELVRSKRRMEDRIAQRVIDAIKKS